VTSFIKAYLPCGSVHVRDEGTIFADEGLFSNGCQSSLVSKCNRYCRYIFACIYFVIFCDVKAHVDNEACIKTDLKVRLGHFQIIERQIYHIIGCN